MSAPGIALPLAATDEEQIRPWAEDGGDRGARDEWILGGAHGRAVAELSGETIERHARKAIPAAGVGQASYVRGLRVLDMDSGQEEPKNRPDAVADDYDDATDDRGAARRFADWIWDTVKTWGPALLTVLLIRSVFAEPFRIPSGSMVPTLLIGDHIVVTKSSYGWRIPLTRIPLTELEVPERGDVVVFVYPGSDEGQISYWVDLPFPRLSTLDYVKRVVGLPGDTIEVKDNTVYLNGVPQSRTSDGDFNFVDDRCRENPTTLFEEKLGDHSHAALASVVYGFQMRDYGPVTVPQGHIFAMGDNRDHSSDSRVWGFVPLRNIKGKAQYVWLSYDQCTPGIPVFGTFRSGRFGEPVR